MSEIRWMIPSVITVGSRPFCSPIVLPLSGGVNLVFASSEQGRPGHGAGTLGGGLAGLDSTVGLVGQFGLDILGGLGYIWNRKWRCGR